MMLTVTFLLVTIAATVQGQSLFDILNHLPTGSAIETNAKNVINEIFPNLAAQSTTEQFSLVPLETELETNFRNIITSVNTYVINILGPAANAVKAISDAVEDFQSGNNTDFSEIIESIRDATNISNDKCIAEENTSLQNLLNNVSTSIRACYPNLNENIEGLTSQSAQVVSNITQMISALANEITTCTTDFNMMNIFQLLQCLGSVVGNSSEEYQTFISTLNTTTTNTIELVTLIMDDTRICVPNALRELTIELRELLTNFIECVLD